LSSLFRYSLSGVGILLSLPLLVLLLFIPTTPVSTVGILYLSSYLLLVIGMICAPWRPGHSFVFILAGGALAFTTIAIRSILPPSGTQMNLITLPGPSGPRLLNRILNEQDVVLFGAQVAPYLGAISPSEETSLDSRFSQTFNEMKRAEVTQLSPFLTTYLNQQHPTAFDALVAEPDSGTPPESGIIFLHGFGGNFNLQCWLMAQAGYFIDAVTVCPSTSPSGAWWKAEGQAILEETITYLHQRGVKRIYLAGLSNGGIGATRLADSFKKDLAGLILISGADPNATITEMPVLVLHGKYDERIPVSMMEQYASAAGMNATYHLFEGDHFLLLKQADQAQKVMIDWLRQQESKSQ
jgi:dienelactone hydrolase